MCRNYGIWDFSLLDLGVVLTVSLAAGTVTGWLFYDRLQLGLCISGALFFMAKPRYMRWQLQRRKRILLLQFRDVLYSISSAVSVGRSMAQALEESMDFWKGTYDEKEKNHETEFFSRPPCPAFPAGASRRPLGRPTETAG